MLSFQGVGASDYPEGIINDSPQDDTVVHQRVVYVVVCNASNVPYDFNYTSPREDDVVFILYNNTWRPGTDDILVRAAFDWRHPVKLVLERTDPPPEITRYELNPDLVNVDGPLAEQRGRHTMSKPAETIPEERSASRPSGGSVGMPKAEGTSTPGVALGGVLLVLVAVGLVFFLGRARGEASSLGWLQAPAHLTVAGPSEEAEVPEVHWDLTAMPEWLFDPPEDESGVGFAS